MDHPPSTPGATSSCPGRTPTGSESESPDRNRESSDPALPPGGIRYLRQTAGGLMGEPPKAAAASARTPLDQRSRASPFCGRWRLPDAQARDVGIPARGPDFRRFRLRASCPKSPLQPSVLKSSQPPRSHAPVSARHRSSRRRSPNPRVSTRTRGGRIDSPATTPSDGVRPANRCGARARQELRQESRVPGPHPPLDPATRGSGPPLDAPS